MIPGDIDLTENLDFYRDKEEKEYENTKDFNPPAILDVAGGNYSMYTNEWSWHNYSDISTVNTFSVDSNNRTINITTITTIDDYIPDIITQYRNSWHSSTSTFNVTWTCSSNTTTKNISELLELPTTTKLYEVDKLFGTKPEKNYDNESYRVLSLFNNKYEKRYKNAREFSSNFHIDDNYLWYYDDREAFIEDELYKLFGEKEEKEYPSTIPWLEELKRFSRRMYDDYMEELLDGEKDYYSYLTNYNWLGIH